MIHACDVGQLSTDAFCMAVLMVLADRYYKKSDYITDFDEFLEQVRKA